jgi:hypothetical protein
VDLAGVGGRARRRQGLPGNVAGRDAPARELGVVERPEAVARGDQSGRWASEVGGGAGCAGGRVDPVEPATMVDGKDLLRVRLEDTEGHSLELAVLSPHRTIRISVVGPAGPELRGAFDPREFKALVESLKKHGLDADVGVSGRFHVLRQVPGDRRGYVDWGNGGPQVWIFPSRGDAEGAAPEPARRSESG